MVERVSWALKHPVPPDLTDRRVLDAVYPVRAEPELDCLLVAIVTATATVNPIFDLNQPKEVYQS